MSARRYDLVAIDLDGTLLDHAGRVSEANVRSIRRARDAGMVVVVCTGRALIETRAVLAAIDLHDPVVVSGGAMVADPVTGATLERFTLDAGLVSEVVSFLHSRGHAALVLKDPHATMYDYLAVTPTATGGEGERAGEGARGVGKAGEDGAAGEEGLDPASRWWFKKMGVRVRFAAALHHDEHPEHSIRVGAYAANRPVDDLAAELREAFGDRTNLQHFQGALLPKERTDQGITSVHIVEVFHQRADKWQAIERLIGRLGIDASRVAAIGDQLNDLSMITHAGGAGGLGVAMGNAHERIRAVAGRVTAGHDESGVSVAIEKMLSGEW
jgi:hydroxymethylpyrimidine pyrophosphatase-like HAD family hydrolase